MQNELGSMPHTTPVHAPQAVTAQTASKRKFPVEGSLHAGHGSPPKLARRPGLNTAVEALHAACTSPGRAIELSSWCFDGERHAASLCVLQAGACMGQCGSTLAKCAFASEADRHLRGGGSVLIAVHHGRDGKYREWLMRT